jgi:2-keto-4-pentenoate hydratase/2-oxohepta-3-ene-1,7-dioic acid hydratase in catechol pathway
MKLASFCAQGHSSYGIVRNADIIDAGMRFGTSFPDLHSVISAGKIEQLRELTEAAADYRLADVRLLKPIACLGKILCVGINYPDRNQEYKDGSEPPKYPSLFVRFPDSLVAHEEPLVRPLESKLLDYEGEIALVIGRRGRRIAEAEALGYIAGYSICNEGTIRDWLRHGKFNVTPGKNFERSGSLGPWMVTADDVGVKPLRITTRVNGEVRQDDSTDHMIFPTAFQISYISRFCTLEPGDVIVTGTPAGAGARLDPPAYLVPGDIVEVEVTGIGTLRNHVIDEEGEAPQVPKREGYGRYDRTQKNIRQW